MDESPQAAIEDAVAVLRQSGARFGYLHGSRASGQHRADSDIDIAHREFAAAVTTRAR